MARSPCSLAPWTEHQSRDGFAAGLPGTLSCAPLRRRAPVAWLARLARSLLGPSVRFTRRLRRSDSRHALLRARFVSAPVAWLARHARSLPWTERQSRQLALEPNSRHALLRAASSARAGRVARSPCSLAPLNERQVHETVARLCDLAGDRSATMRSRRDPSMDSNRYTRRDALAMLGTTGTVALSAMGWTSGGGETQPAGTAGDPVARNDEAVRSLIQRQVTDSASSYRPRTTQYPIQHGIGRQRRRDDGRGVRVPASRFHRDPVLLDRIRLAAGFLERSQSARKHRPAGPRTSTRRPIPALSYTSLPRAARLPGATAQWPGALQTFLREGGWRHGERWRASPNHRWVIYRPSLK